MCRRRASGGKPFPPLNGGVMMLWLTISPITRDLRAHFPKNLDFRVFVKGPLNVARKWRFPG